MAAVVTVLTGQRRTRGRASNERRGTEPWRSAARAGRCSSWPARASDAPRPDRPAVRPCPMTPVAPATRTRAPDHSIRRFVPKEGCSLLMCPGNIRCAVAVRPSTIRSAPGSACARVSGEVGEDLSGGPCAGRERALYGTGRPVVAAHVPAPREARRAAERPRWRHGRQRAVDGVRGDGFPGRGVGAVDFGSADDPVGCRRSAGSAVPRRIVACRGRVRPGRGSATCRACPSGPREPTRWRTMEAEPEPDLVAADRSVSTCPVHPMASNVRSRGCDASIDGNQTISYPMGIHS
jgi:hypothetical protein